MLLFSGARFAVSVLTRTGLMPQTVFRLLTDTGADLRPIHGRVNVLVLGMAGGTHAGADLSDTILILSFAQETHSMAMISVPRDLWSDTLRDKVNSAYHYGEEKKQGGGLVLAKAVVSDMTGLPLQYGMVFDFMRFRTIIDLAGGITVQVPEAFTDDRFPVEGRESDSCDGDPETACRYTSLHFDAGLQHMDGERALAYVRSRHAADSNGTDFARGKRQQQVILALKDALSLPETYWPPRKARAIIDAFGHAVDTDMNVSEIATLGKLMIRTPEASIRRISFDDQLYAPPAGMYGRYVLLPRDSFETLHEEIRKLLK